MRYPLLLSVALLNVPAGLLAAVQTPEQRANPSTGEIPHPGYGQEYYYGPATLGVAHSGDLVGGVSPDEPSVSWYKYVSDGATPVIFDLAGSTFSFGFNGFGGGPDGELTVYDSQGRFVAGNETPQIPTTGDSNVPLASPPPGSALPSYKGSHSQPKDPAKPAATYSSSSNSWSNSNIQGLSQLAFVKDPQSNPGSTGSDWNQYPILPAGDYFIAVTGYSTYFAGNPRDTSAIQTYGPAYGGVTPETPFGFVSFHAMSGSYVFNARYAGDFNNDGVADEVDLQLLEDKIAQLASGAGLAPEGFSGGNWIGLPAGLQAFDLTYNGRIDQHDLAAFVRYTGVPEPTTLAMLLPGAAMLMRRRR